MSLEKFGDNLRDGKCDSCDADQVRIEIDGHEFCSMGCAKAFKDKEKK